MNFAALIGVVRKHRHGVSHSFAYPTAERCVFHALIETAEYADAATRPHHASELRAKRQAPDPVLEFGQVGYMILSALALRYTEDAEFQEVATSYMSARGGGVRPMWEELMATLLASYMYRETNQGAFWHLAILAFLIWYIMADQTYGALASLNEAMKNIDARITYIKT